MAKPPPVPQPDATAKAERALATPVAKRAMPEPKPGVVSGAAGGNGTGAAIVMGTVATAGPAPARPDQGKGQAQGAEGSGEGGATVDENPELVPQLSFWQKPFVQNVLPFLTSLGLHAAIILIGFLTIKAAVVITQVVREQIIIPDAAIVEGAPVGGVKNVGLGGDPDKKAMQDKYPDVETSSQGWADKPSQTLSQALGGGSGDANNTNSVIGLGAGGLGSGKGAGAGKGLGLGGGSGEGGGALAPFGMPGGGVMGPKSPFMGISGNAMRVAYVCDASGSMFDRGGMLKQQLQQAIDVLKPIQAFNVVFFQEGDPEYLSRKLVLAAPANKRKAYDFLNGIVFKGNTNPIPGLKVAFDSNPQLIYLLTDGDFPDNAAVESYIADRNKDKRDKINTIAFGGQSGGAYEKLLQRIAADNGGTYKSVTEQDLGR
jgi:hypothetical protein